MKKRNILSALPPEDEAEAEAESESDPIVTETKSKHHSKSTNTTTTTATSMHKMNDIIRKTLNALNPPQLSAKFGGKESSKAQAWLAELAGFVSEVEPALQKILQGKDTRTRVRTLQKQMSTLSKIEVEARIVCVVKGTTVGFPERAVNRLLKHLMQEKSEMKLLRDEKFQSQVFSSSKKAGAVGATLGGSAVRFRFKEQEPDDIVFKDVLFSHDVPVYKSSDGWSGIRFAFSVETPLHDIKSTEARLGPGWQSRQDGSVNSISREITRSVFGSVSELPFLSLELSSVGTTKMTNEQLQPYKTTHELELEFHAGDLLGVSCTSEAFVDNLSRNLFVSSRHKEDMRFRSWLISCFATHQICFGFY